MSLESATYISDLNTSNPTAGDPKSQGDDHLRLLKTILVNNVPDFTYESSVASAATCDIGGAKSAFVQITGTTGISSFGTNYKGPKFIRFAGALTLTHNASTLILPNGANITTTAGDSCIAIPFGTGWYVCEYSFNTAQAWQDLTSSRATGTSYTNSTGRPITVAASVAGNTANSTVAVAWTIGGVAGIAQNSLVTGTTAANTSLAVTAVVPPGATYSLVVTQATLSNWRELR